MQALQESREYLLGNIDLLNDEDASPSPVSSKKLPHEQSILATLGCLPTTPAALLSGCDVWRRRSRDHHHVNCTHQHFPTLLSGRAAVRTRGWVRPRPYCYLKISPLHSLIMYTRDRLSSFDTSAWTCVFRTAPFDGVPPRLQCYRKPLRHAPWPSPILL